MRSIFLKANLLVNWTTRCKGKQYERERTTREREAGEIPRALLAKSSLRNLHAPPRREKADQCCTAMWWTRRVVAKRIVSQTRTCHPDKTHFRICNVRAQSTWSTAKIGKIILRMSRCFRPEGKNRLQAVTAAVSAALGFTAPDEPRNFAFIRTRVCGYDASASCCSRRIPVRGIASIYISVVKERFRVCMHENLCAMRDQQQPLGSAYTLSCVRVFLHVRALACAHICRDTRVLVDRGLVYPEGDWRTTGTS